MILMLGGCRGAGSARAARRRGRVVAGGYLLVVEVAPRGRRWPGPRLDGPRSWATTRRSATRSTSRCIGLGAGGWHGLGPGNSHNKFAFLPEQHTDFAFSYLGEELGLIGAVIVVVALLDPRLARTANRPARAATRFGRLRRRGTERHARDLRRREHRHGHRRDPGDGRAAALRQLRRSALVTNLAAVGIMLSIERQGRSLPAECAHERPWACRGCRPGDPPSGRSAHRWRYRRPRLSRAGGGRGARSARERAPFAGTAGGIERRLAAAAGLASHPVPASGVPRPGPRRAAALRRATSRVAP